MAKALVIVESPAKAKTINKYLGKQYVVKASLGHIKDLPKKDLAVDVEHGFEPRYEVIEGKKKLIAELKQSAKRRRKHLPRGRPGSRRRGHLLSPAGRAARQARNGPRHLPGDVQRNHQEGHREGIREARPGQRRIWWMRSRRGACSTGWWATRFLRCFGIKSAAGFPPAACKPSRCA